MDGYVGFAYNDWPFLLDWQSSSSNESRGTLPDQTGTSCEKTGGTALHYACFNGQENLVKFLLENYQPRINAIDNKGFTPLMTACEEGHLSIVKRLVSTNGSVRRFKRRCTSLVLTCYQVHNFGGQILVCNADIKNKSGGLALHVAAYKDHTAIAKCLIEKCAVNVNEQDNDGRTSLMLACWKGHLSTVKLLHSNQCDASIKKKDGFTAFHFASLNGHSSIVEYLIEEFAVNVNEPTSDGRTSLMLACQEGHLSTVKLLHSNQCDVMIKEEDGFTAFHFASLNGHSSIVEYLIEKFAVIVNEPTNDGRTSLMLACQEGHLSTVKLLHSNQCDVMIKEEDGFTAFHFASLNGHSSIVEYLIEEFAVNVNEPTSNGWTSLMLACWKGHLSTVKLLHSNQCDVMIKEEDGFTAFHFASLNGHSSIVEYLIEEFAVNVNEPTSNGWTSLMLACWKGHLSTVKLLHSNQCDVMIKEEDGFTAFHFASLNGHSSIVEYLIEEFAVIVNEPTSDGLTSLMLACQEGHLSTVKLLHSNQCDVMIKEENGFTAFHFASLNGHSSIVEYLIEEFAVNVNEPTNDGRTSLMLACWKGHLSTVKLLHSNRCDASIKKKDGFTAFHFASLNGHSSIVEYLIEEFAVNVNEPTSNGRTSLMLACQKGHVSTVQRLHSSQCDVNIKDKIGYTALHVALVHGHSAIVEYLIDNCAINVNEQAYSGDTSFHFSSNSGQSDSALFFLRRASSFVLNDSKLFSVAVKKCCLAVAQQFANFGCFNKRSAIHDVLSIKKIKDNAEVLQLFTSLLNHGASASFRNSRGKLPYECASGESRYILRHAWLESQFSKLASIGCSSPSQIKVCVIGDEEAGKTSLIESLQQSYFNAIAKKFKLMGPGKISRTAGIKFLEARIDSAGDLLFCDFGGQKSFRKIHSLFFSSETVFVLVTDMSMNRSLQDILDSGFYWLSFAKCSLCLSADKKARLMLIGSRGDQVGPERLRQLALYLKRNFSEWFYISDEEFVVDCRSPKARAMDAVRDHLRQLKQQCIKRATKVPNIVRKVETKLLPRLRKCLASSSNPLHQLARSVDRLLPEKISAIIVQLLRNNHEYSEEALEILNDYNLTEDKILRTTSHSIASGLLLAMVDETVFPGLRKDVQTQLLKYLHTYSSIILFEEEDILVVNPNWLCHRVIGPLMSPKEFPFHLNSADGIACVRDIRITLENFNKREKTPLVANDVDEAIRVLCLMEICYPLPDNSQKYQFPALIQEKQPADAWIRSDDMRVYVGRRIACQKDTDIITPGTMPFIQARTAVSRKPSSLSPIVWQGGVKTFEMFDNLRFEILVELVVNDRAIDIVVRGPEHSEMECYKLLETTKEMVEKMLGKRSPGTSLLELVLSRKDMESLAETRCAYSYEAIADAKDSGLFPQIALSPTSVEYVSDLLAVSEKHVNIVLPCHPKRSLLRGLVSTSVVPETFARSLGMRTAQLSLPSTARSVFVEWNRRMDATLPKLFTALKETKQIDIIKMFIEEKLFSVKVTGDSNDSGAQGGTENPTPKLSDNEPPPSDRDSECSSACFIPPEEPKREEAITSGHVESTNLAKDTVVEDHHIEAFKNELFDDSDDVILFGSKLLGWSHRKVKIYLSDRAERRIDQKMSRILYRWKEQIEKPSIGALLLVLKDFEKDGLANQLLEKCTKTVK